MEEHLQTKGNSRQRQDGGKPRANQISICIFLVATIFVIYWQLHAYEFINFDDNSYITENEIVQGAFTKESFVWAFTTSHFPYWHPITWLSHMLDYQLFGLNPKGHHLTNVFFHITNSLLLFLILLRMTGAYWKCGFVAALFAVHPINIESVAWIAERKNVLSTFFWLLTIWAYIRYAQKTTIKKYSLVALFLILGLMSKPMLVTLPFILFMLDFWPLGRMKYGQRLDSIIEGNTDGPLYKEATISRLICEKIPLLLLAVGSSLMTVFFRESERIPRFENMAPLQDRIINALTSYLEYIRMLVWPRDLSILYPHPGSGLALWKGWVCGIVLLSISLFTLRLIFRLPYLAFGWFWFLGTLVPMIGIIQVGHQGMADRFMYVPQIGIFIVIAWGLPNLFKNSSLKNNTIWALAGVTILTMIVLSWNHTKYWKNSVTLFQHTITVSESTSPDFALAYYSLGHGLVSQGKYEEGITQYRKALKIHPEYLRTLNSLGFALNELKRYDEAIPPLKKAISISNTFDDAYNNLGNAVGNLGKIKEAIVFYKEAIRINDNSYWPHYNIGIRLTQLGFINEAITHYRKAILIKPDSLIAKNKLSELEQSWGKVARNITTYQQSIKNNPNDAKSHKNLADILIQLKRYEEATHHYKTAIKLKPDYAQAHNNLGTLFGQNKMLNDAIQHYREAIRLKPDYSQAHNNLGGYLGQLGNYKEAETHFKLALQIDPSFINATNNLRKIQSIIEKSND